MGKFFSCAQRKLTGVIMDPNQVPPQSSHVATNGEVMAPSEASGPAVKLEGQADSMNGLHSICQYSDTSSQWLAASPAPYQDGEAPSTPGEPAANLPCSTAPPSSQSFTRRLQYIVDTPLYCHKSSSWVLTLALDGFRATNADSEFAFSRGCFCSQRSRWQPNVY